MASTSLYYFVLLVCALHLLMEQCLASLITFDSRSIRVDDKPILLVGGSFHYPRTSVKEWPEVMRSMKNQGINLLQTYVFWDIHETSPGNYSFTDDIESNENLVYFLQTAQKEGLFVSLRFGPYVCAEWNYGGLPVWLRDYNMTFRTDDPMWMKVMLNFIDESMRVVGENKLLAGDGGPVIMLQIENEYGNIEDKYGERGARYVQLLSAYATRRGQDNTYGPPVPWIMCQQGEGNGTAPAENIINTCNGFYCDDWIEKHANDFPNQPHFFTENWPGWFQKWGDGVPHRPSSDVAFSVARWFAKGGSFMVYYMAFGGSNFGRTVGGPSIVTSYDYDVAVNEYGLHAEPKYSLLQALHKALMSSSQTMLNQAPPVAVVPNPDQPYCEMHAYNKDPNLGDSAEGNNNCIVFLSNGDKKSSCTFKVPVNSGNDSGDEEVEVPPWSVSILGGDGCTTEIFNTKKSTVDFPANQKHYSPVPIKRTVLDCLSEPIPSAALVRHGPVPVTLSEVPLEQLKVTKDTTDYLWYSTSATFTSKGASSTIAGSNAFLVDKDTSSSTHTLSFTVGTAAGTFFRLFLNGQEVDIDHRKLTLKSVDQATVDVVVPLHDFQLGLNTIDLLFVGMGIQNYGAFLDSIQAGIVSGQVLLDDKPLKAWKHSVGLLGEALGFEKGPVVAENTITRGSLLSSPLSSSSCTDAKIKSKMTWQRMSFDFEDASLVSSSSAHFALDLAALGKGQIWVNDHMLGRYWTITAEMPMDAAGGCQACDEQSFVGPYTDIRCRTGCGDPSQRYYKVPSDWLRSTNNTIVVLEELSGSVSDISLVLVSMKQ